MRFFRRSLVALGIAATLPTIIFVAVGAFIFLREESRRIENEALERAQLLTALSDARLRGDIETLNVLAGSTYVEARNWPEFYRRLHRVRQNSPHWTTIALYDATTGAAIFDIRQPFGSNNLPALDAQVLDTLQRNRTAFVDRIRRDPEPLAYVYTPVLDNSLVRFVLAVGINPEAFQPLIASQGSEDVVTALVDRDGLFVARSMDPEHRIGHPATEYVRAALANGSQGLYRGRTYEGMRNVSAYYVSPWSGWSTHIAISSAHIDGPLSLSLLVATAAALGGILLGGILTVLVLRDMAERRRAEETLRQSQKMEAIGQLTGGIAHDFNNLLTAIIGNLDLIRTRTTGDGRLQRLASNALEAARRGAKLSSQLLAFSRDQRMQVEPVSLTQLLGGMGDLLTQSVGPSISLTIRIDPEAECVLSDANQLELALLNLAVNARDAMPDGGTLQIEVRPAATREVRGLPKRPYVTIAVKDSGVGMPDNVRTRAMEPFFTTKPVGQGTGLGLSQVYGIVHESGGVVHIESAPEEGTTVRMVLPAAAPIAVPVGAGSQTTPTIPSPSTNVSTRILVVDDDHQVRRFIAESLRSQGYAVIDCPSGAAGLNALRDGRFDLLVADFAMPVMNGAELVRAALEIQPDLRVLIVSGYADSAAIAEVLGDARMLRKPFAISELSAAVSQALASRTPIIERRTASE